ncbi:MAG: alpha-ribazole phosphatase [Bacteroidales bacterium]|nr:alpha-ribazole phosphatase [Bacteroidales bacterium]
MKLTAIRHTSVDVPPGVCYGFSDVPLNKSFETEAQIVKQNLNNYTFDKIYSSPLSRCTSLADYCGFTNYELDSRIKELNFGNWEMRSWMEIDKNEAQAWFADWFNYPAQNGESYAIMQKRVYNFLNDIKLCNHTNICLISHAGVIRLIHVYLGLCPINESFEFAVEYGQIFHFDL